MRLKAPPPPNQPKAWTLRFIGPLLLIVAAARLLEELIFTNSENRDSGIISALVVGTVGLLATLFYQLTKPRPQSPRSTATRGFSLMEVMVAVTLVVLIFGMISGVLFSVIDTQSRVSAMLTQEKIGHGVLALLVRDLEGTAGYGLGPVVFKVTDNQNAVSEADEISFITTSPGAVSDLGEDEDDGASFSSDPDADQQDSRPRPPRYRLVTYALRSAPGTGGSDEERFVLCRRSVALTSESRDPSAAEGPLVEVVDGLRAFKVEVRGSLEEDWQNDWEETARLPLAVRLSVQTMVSAEERLAAQESDFPSPEPRVFTTTVSLLSRSQIVTLEQP